MFPNFDVSIEGHQQQSASGVLLSTGSTRKSSCGKLLNETRIGRKAASILANNQSKNIHFPNHKQRNQCKETSHGAPESHLCGNMASRMPNKRVQKNHEMLPAKTICLVVLKAANDIAEFKA